MKIKEITSTDQKNAPPASVEAELRQEVLDKIGQPRHPAYRAVNVDAVVQKAKPYFSKPATSKGLAVDKAFMDLYPELESPNTAKKDNKTKNKFVQPDATKYKASEPTISNATDDSAGTFYGNQYTGSLGKGNNDSTIGRITKAAMDKIKSAVPGAQEISDIAGKSADSFSKGFNFAKNMPTNKGSGSYKRK